MHCEHKGKCTREHTIFSPYKCIVSQGSITIVLQHMHHNKCCTIQMHCFTKEHNNCFEVHCFTREQNNCFAIQVHCFAREHNNCFTKQCMCHNATINCTCGAFTIFMQFLWIVAAFTPSATLGPALMLPTSARTRDSNASLPCRPLSPRACRANRIASASG